MPWRSPRPRSSRGAGCDVAVSDLHQGALSVLRSPDRRRAGGRRTQAGHPCEPGTQRSRRAPQGVRCEWLHGREGYRWHLATDLISTGWNSGRACASMRCAVAAAANRCRSGSSCPMSRGSKASSSGPMSNVPSVSNGASPTKGERNESAPRKHEPDCRAPDAIGRRARAPLGRHDREWDRVSRVHHADRRPQGRRCVGIRTRAPGAPRAVGGPGGCLRDAPRPLRARMKFCDLPKIGIYCDTYTPATETRREDEVKVVRLTLRIQPLTPELAQAIEPYMRKTLFKPGQAHPDPTPQVHEITFNFNTPRQLLKIFASKDSPTATIAFDQVHIGRLRARLQKDVEGWALLFKATFGPCGPADLAYVNEWYGTQRFITFTPAEGDLDFGDATEVDEPEEETPEVDGAELAPEPAATAAPRRGRRPRVPQTH